MHPQNLHQWFCLRCGTANIAASSYCTQRRTPHAYQAQHFQHQSAPPQWAPVYPAVQQVMVIVPKSRAVYILLGLFLGGLGIHNFYAGHVGRGVAQLLISIFTFWLIIPIFIIGLWVLIEVIVTDSDETGQKMR